MRRLLAVLTGSALLLGCLTPEPEETVSAGADAVTPRSTVRVTLVGDVILGRGIAPAIEGNSGEVFGGVRHLVAGADVAGVNLESPLTLRPHQSSNEHALEADPGGAVLLAATGFDLVSFANNHSGDAGADGLLDTIEAVEAAGMAAVGAGADLLQAARPAIHEVNGLRVGFLSFDATGVGPAADIEPGVNPWDPTTSAAAITELSTATDLVVTSIHGGSEYLTVNDPLMTEIAAIAAEAGADVVWGHGAHVIQPVTTISGNSTRSRRATVVATSLGNFLFDQAGTDRTTGAMLEVLADADGVVAYRTAKTRHPDRRVEFVEWDEPPGDAGWLDGSWWSVLRLPAPWSTSATTVDEFRHGDLIAAAVGDINDDGAVDIVASFRRPHRSTPFMELRPDIQWQDSSGRSAHLGVYGTEGLDEIWVAGAVVLPIAQLEVCDRSIAVVHDALDDPAPVATSAWQWNGFGFDTAPDLPGGGVASCSDIDGDGMAEPVILRDGVAFS